MPLMGSLYIGSSGLQTSQNALNTTAHNLSNVDTTGYTRQQVQQSNRAYVTLSTDPKSIANKQTGLGVTYSRVKQVRDYFLDKTYRKESGRSMFYEVSTEVMEEVESQLGELNGEAFQTTMTDFWTAVQELSKDPSSSVTQGLIVQRASEFVQRASAVYAGLSSYQDNLNTQIRQNVDKINKYGNQLLTLNDQIRAIESGGIEHANDLRDARNQILDELAELTNMIFSEDRYGSVSVQIEGVDFVKDGTCYEIAMKTDEATGFVTLIGYAVSKNRRSKWANYVNGVAFLPYLMPSLAVGAAFFILFSNDKINLFNTYTLLIIAGVIKYIPFASRSALNSMLQLSGEIEEAAIIQDIPWYKRMLRIIIPIQKSSIINGYMLPFMTCLRELSLFLLLCTQGFILSTTLDYFDEMGLYAFSSAINLILIVTILIFNTLVNKLTGSSLDEGIGGK